MDKSDIRDLRRWHRDAALRARKAGFDVVYVYAGHDLSLLMHFLSRRHNRRTDEYGGSLENRVRLFREMIEVTKDAVGDTCGIAVRFAVEELLGEDGITSGGEGRDVVEMLAELPDLWDVNVSDWANDSTTSRFSEEGSQTEHIEFVKQVTGKPVVGVGRFTSPDTMASLVARGVLDFIGAARPSIADPYLPNKIEEGRIDDIRECIGCNICVTGDLTQTPIRCTQNPTMGEEWRRDWHPEFIAPKASEESVLIVGAGPAGLECARALGQRGYTVALAEASREAGGRVSVESRLPGLAVWARVRDYRMQQINNMANVSLYYDSELGAADILDYGFGHVVVATGAHWRRDGVGRRHRQPVSGSDRANVVAADDVMAGAKITGPVVLYDDDHFYLGGVLAEKLRADGHEVTLVTPAPDVSHWTHYTMEQHRIQKSLLELGVSIVTQHELAAVAEAAVEVACVFTGKRHAVPCGTLVMVTSRQPVDIVFRDLLDDAGALESAGIKSVTAIGDCLAPSTIAAAVYGGHRYAREMDKPKADGVPFLREIPALS